MTEYTFTSHNVGASSDAASTSLALRHPGKGVIPRWLCFTSDPRAGWFYVAGVEPVQEPLWIPTEYKHVYMCGI